jgi:hypothetical protein
MKFIKLMSEGGTLIYISAEHIAAMVQGDKKTSIYLVHHHLDRIHVTEPVESIVTRLGLTVR